MKSCEYIIDLKVKLSHRVPPDTTAEKIHREQLQAHIDRLVFKYIDSTRNQQNLMNTIMEQQIEALSNAFNIGFSLGAKPLDGMHSSSTRVELKRAIEEGLKLMASQHPVQRDAESCGWLNPGYYPVRNGKCTCCGESRTH